MFLTCKQELGEHCETSKIQQIWLKHIWTIFFCISYRFIFIFDLETWQVSNYFKSGPY